MKLIHSDTLASMPREIKELVRDGVYSLYALPRGDAGFVLVTDRGELYLASASGSIRPAPSAASLTELAPGEAVSFSDPSSFGSASVNVA